MNQKFKKIIAREIIDSRGIPTVEVDIRTSNGVFRSSCPAGKSTGKNEAKFIRSGVSEFKDFSVQGAVESVLSFQKDFETKEYKNIEDVDKIIKSKDNTETFEKIGTNCSLPISISFFRLFSFYDGSILIDYVSKVSKRDIKLPVVGFNLLNGGEHSGNDLAFQEIMVSVNGNSFKAILAKIIRFYYRLEGVIIEKYGKVYTGKGDEGGFAPPISTLEEAFDLLTQTVETSGISDIKIAIDCAANSFYKEGKYNFKRKVCGEIIDVSYSTEQMVEYYKEVLEKNSNIYMIEDPFEETDHEGWKKLNNENIILVGDDLLVTSAKRVNEAKKNSLCSGVLIKPNQAGTISGTLDAVKAGLDSGMKIMTSHRSGETEDTFISDFSVGIGADYMKAGAPCRGERVSKYNQLIRLEEIINTRANKGNGSSKDN